MDSVSGLITRSASSLIRESPSLGESTSAMVAGTRPLTSMYIVKALVLWKVEETLKAVGPFCLVSMPGKIKDPYVTSNLKIGLALH